MTAPGRVLIVDDERNIRRALAMVLDGEGYQVEEAASAEEALRRATSRPDAALDAVLLDVKLPGASGLETLERLPRELPVIMISGHATIEEAVRATRLGALDFLEKPLDRDRVLLAVRNAVERARLGREVIRLRAAALAHGEPMIGDSPAMAALREQLRKVAPTRGRVLITGESGTGKELIARALHGGGPTSRGEFVKVNCAAIPPDLLESELFGHERGAFTGATGTRRGLFELADGGTLLLDEVGEMPMAAQAKVLRVIQTGELTRVGGERTLRAEPRILAATNRDLEQAVAAGAFREDLYFRLNVIRLHAPPLRERQGDIPTLAAVFAERACREHGFAEKAILPEALALLSAHSWPGNIRELRNVIERAVVLGGEEITAADLPVELRKTASPPLPPDEALTLREFRERSERDFIRRRLEQHGWNISRTAEALGVERTQLHKKLRALGLARE